MPNIMVTGASGMIGMYLCSNLLHKQYTVFATDSKTNEFVGTNDAYKFTQCDISDKDSITNILLSNKIDAVVHLANSVDNDLDTYITDSEVKKSKMVDKYFYSAVNKAKAGSIILLSTTDVYGLQKGREPIREENPEKCVSNYGSLKLTGEKILNKEFKKSQTKAIIARAAPIYSAEYTQNLRDRVYNTNEDYAYKFGDGDYGFSFCCVFNLVDFISGIIAENGGRHSDLFNIADTKMITAAQIIDYEMAHHRINRVEVKDNSYTWGSNKAKLKTDYRYFDPQHTFLNWCVDNTKARRYAPFRWSLNNTK